MLAFCTGALHVLHEDAEQCGDCDDVGYSVLHQCLQQRGGVSGPPWRQHQAGNACQHRPQHLPDRVNKGGSCVEAGHVPSLEWMNITHPPAPVE